MTTNAKTHITICKNMEQAARALTTADVSSDGSTIQAHMKVIWKLTTELRQLDMISDLNLDEYESELEQEFRETTETIMMKSRKSLLICIIMIITSISNYLKTNSVSPEIFILLGTAIKFKTAIVKSSDMCMLLFWVLSRSEPFDEQTSSILENLSYIVSWFKYDSRELRFMKYYDERLNLEFIKSKRIQNGIMSIIESSDIM
jgi:hypothetical protein